MQIRPVTSEDFDALIGLLTGMPGIVLREADQRPALLRYLERNPGMSLAAEDGGRLIGCALAGHDGRRGYLYHVAVAPSHRRRGLGRALVERCLAELAREGIDKVHVDTLSDHRDAQAFWEALGWTRRNDLVRFSFSRSSDPNA